jgi:hypothetical protein
MGTDVDSKVPGVLARRFARFALPVLLATGLVTPAAATAAIPPPPDFHDCPGGFLVYQALPAGPVKLPAASYNITVINMSCDYASRALESFLGREDLPPPWTANVPTKTFSNKTGNFSLSSSRQGPGDPPGCPPFTIVPRDRIGTIPLPRGRYALRTGGADPLSCLAAARRLIVALEEPPGQLSGWRANPLADARPGATLRNATDQTITIRRLDGRTAGGGYMTPD